MKISTAKVTSYFKLSLLVLLAAAYGKAVAVDGPFIPPNNQKLLVIGQDITSIDNYRNQVGHEPSGVTTYIALSDLSGLTQQVDNGGGPNNAGYLQANYPNSIHAIAVYIKGVQDQAANGSLDGNMDELVRILKSWNRPIMLRFGYEADGEWNSNEPSTYIRAFRRMYDRIQRQDADNIAMVWQVATYCGGSYQGRNFRDWYPGDQYVDWLGMSYFTPQDCNNSAINDFMTFARQKNIPVMIAESAPQRFDIEAGTYNPTVQRTGPDQPRSGQQIWNEWFVNYFNFINNNSDYIKIAAYINADWDTQRLWQFPYPEGYWGDSRVQGNSLVRSNWLSEVRGSDWIPADGNLFTALTSGTGTDTDTGSDTGSDTDSDTGSDTDTTVDQRVEAESGSISSPARIYSDASASGGQGVAYIYQAGAGFTINNAPESNSVSIAYASANSGGTISLYVNGSDNNVSFNGTGSWVGNYQTVRVNVSIPAGATVTVQYDNGDTAMNVDYLVFHGAGSNTDTVTDTDTDSGTGSETDTDTATDTDSNEGRGAFGLDYVNDNTGMLYHEDNGWTANFVYLCLDSDCRPAQLNSGYYEREVSNMSLGQNYTIEFKVQDNSTGQCLSGLQQVSFEAGGDVASSNCD